MTNLDLAGLALKSLEKMNVGAVCICPGARNSPLVETLSKNESFEKFYFFEERSAGFFALGKARSTGRPVAVVTTSGTAVGELLPAMMEGFYSALPLIAVTADRPPHYRGTGAPQSCEQVGIFSHYARTMDWSKHTRDFNLIFDSSKPFHLNICFEEPLIDSAGPNAVDVKVTVLERPRLKQESLEQFSSFLQKFKNPFVILGGLTEKESVSVSEFLKKSLLPFYAEGISQLRESVALKNQRIQNADGLFKRARENGYAIDGVLRIGDIPTHRIWRDLDVVEPIPVLSVSSKQFSGLPGGEVICENLNFFFEATNPTPFDSSEYARLKAADEDLSRKLLDLYEKFPLSEPAQFHFLSTKISSGQKIYLGNSLPIRQWDLAATAEEKNQKVGASRGLNGIDGQLSYFLGTLKPGEEAMAVVGDLTALYDLQAPWILDQLSNKKFRVVIVNNSGGKIFWRMFKKKDYLNEHGISFGNWAQMWNLTYEQTIDVRSAKLTSQIIELKPDAQQTSEFWSQL